MYKNHAQKILTRINTVTGIPYSNDSTIFGEALLYQDLYSQHLRLILSKNLSSFMIDC